MKRLLPLLLAVLLLLSACGQGESRTLHALLGEPVGPLPELGGDGLLFSLRYSAEPAPLPPLSRDGEALLLTPADAYADPLCQQATYGVSRGKAIVTVEEISRLAWALSPCLSALDEDLLPAALEERGWTPFAATQYTDGVWAIDYFLPGKYRDYRALYLGSCLVSYDDTLPDLTVYCSAGDGHVICIEKCAGNDREALPEIWQDAAPASPWEPGNGHRCDALFPAVPCQSLIEENGGIHAPRESMRDPDEGLQESARARGEGLTFSCPEDAMEYAWRLSTCFTGGPTRLICYSNDIWELRWDNSPVAWSRSPVTVFFSALDGHIIYVERRGE